MSVHRALRITTLASAINFVLAFSSAILVARLLTPSEIGVYSIAVSLIGFAQVLRDFGVGQYIVQLKTVNRDDLRACMTVMMLSAWSVALVLLALAPLGASFYRQPNIADVFRVLALSVAVLPLGSHILSMMKRDMQFDRVAGVQIVSGLLSTGTTLFLAWRGFGTLSMAWGSVAGNVANVVLLSVLRPSLALLLPTRHGLRRVLGFGSAVSLGGIVQQVAVGGPDMVLGRTLSAEAVAQYSRAASPLSMISGKVDEILQQVFGPVFARGLREKQAAKDMLTRTIVVHTGLQWPLLVILALTGKSLIHLLFGPQWDEAGRLSPWITLWAAVVAPIAYASSALVAAGHPGAALRARFVSAIALMGVLCLSFWFGLTEVVWGLLIFRIGQFWAWQREMREQLGFDNHAMWQACVPSLRFTLYAMSPALIVHVGLAALWPSMPDLLQILSVGGVGAAGVLTALLCGSHPLRNELLQLIR